VQPEVLDTEANFPDFYAYGKAYAEKMVRHWADGLQSKLILRLGILVGDTVEGNIHRIDGPYHTPEGFKKLRGLIEKWRGPLTLPGRKNSRLPLVPVDSAAKAVVNLCLHSRKEEWQGTRSFHITPKEGVPADTLYRSTLNHLGLPPMEIKLLEKVPDFILKRVAEMAIDFPQEELEYLLNLPLFDSLETRRILGEDWCPEFSDYEKTMWKGYDKYVENHI
jgi:nucleoside-diphosphate-sugar epimerase